MIAPAVTTAIVNVINLSIGSLQFLTPWKMARVCPIFKNGKSDAKSNYTPISIQCVLSKILEKHVHNHLYSYLMKYNLINLDQSGFRKFHSLVNALAKMVFQWSTNMNKRDLTVLIFLNLRKAFDMVNHDLLLRKLKQYRISDNALYWFTSYLTDRKQYVQINQNKSESETITLGVPQGCILAPWLYMNDLALEIEQSQLDMYTDDSTLGAAGGTLDVIEQKLKLDIYNIVNWCDDNRMAINYDKTKAI